jgi:hypothetical protein
MHTAQYIPAPTQPGRLAPRSVHLCLSRVLKPNLEVALNSYPLESNPCILRRRPRPETSNIHIFAGTFFGFALTVYGVVLRMNAHFSIYFQLLHGLSREVCATC